MALKTLMLRKRIGDKRAELEALRAKDTDFENRATELEASINEAQTDEEQSAVADEVEKFEKEKQEHENQKENLSREVGDLEKELEEAEKKQPAPEQKEERSRKTMNFENNKAFFGLNAEQRDAFIGNDEVQAFLTRTREARMANRAITGEDLLIPTIVLDLIRENVLNWSKLYRHVNTRYVSGNARQVVMGTIPEAVWTEMCADLNELNLSFAGVELDGYKVGGYIAVCNAVLEDSDIALATEIINALGQAIGLALDKAILYGTGTKMPMGIVTRLAQTTDPQATNTTIPWVDLHSSNIVKIAAGTSGAELFQAIVGASGAAKGKYSRGEKFWAMNETTYTALMAAALTVNAAGAIVSGVQATMPVVGGIIEVLNFIPDNVIIGGYGDLYLLAERAGATMQRSDEVRFIQDQTVFKGTARYDGIPVIAEAFVVIGLNGTTPAANGVTFAPDTANATLGE